MRGGLIRSMNKKKAMMVGGLAMAIMLSSNVLGAHASTTKSTSDKTEKGTVVSVSSDSFDLKANNKTYTVKTSDTTVFKDKKGATTMKLSDIKKGDTVKAKGVLTKMKLSAKSVTEFSR